MATNTAPQIQYRQEFIKLAEQRVALMRQTVTTEAVYKGNQAYFLVAGSGHATAVTRGVNGLIPSNPDSLTQVAATLVEWHDLRKATSFNIFESQGDRRRIMQEASVGVLNRKIDADIFSALATATVSPWSAAGQKASLAMVLHAKSLIVNAEFPMDGGISCVISPAFEAYISQTPEFTNANYVNDKPLTQDLQMFRWKGINFIVHPNISGKATNAELCYMWHRDAVAHAINVGDIMTAIGYHEEQDYSFARTTAYMGSAVLQNSGIVCLKHDGSAYA